MGLLTGIDKLHPHPTTASKAFFLSASWEVCEGETGKVIYLFRCLTLGLDLFLGAPKFKFGGFTSWVAASPSLWNLVVFLFPLVLSWGGKEISWNYFLSLRI